VDRQRRRRKKKEKHIQKNKDTFSDDKNKTPGMRKTSNGMDIKSTVMISDENALFVLRFISIFSSSYRLPGTRVDNIYHRRSSYTLVFYGFYIDRGTVIIPRRNITVISFKLINASTVSQLGSIYRSTVHEHEIFGTTTTNEYL